MKVTVESLIVLTDNSILRCYMRDKEETAVPIPTLKQLESAEKIGFFEDKQFTEYDVYRMPDGHVYLVEHYLLPIDQDVTRLRLIGSLSA